jgi:hypothetical protein
MTGCEPSWKQGCMKCFAANEIITSAASNTCLEGGFGICQ